MHEAGGALRALGSALRRLPAALRTSPGRRRALTALGSVAVLALLAMAGSGPNLPDRVTAASSTMPATSTTHPPARVKAAPSTTERGDDASAMEWTPSAQLGPVISTSTTVAETTTTVAPPPAEPAPPPVDPDAPAIVARPIPSEPPPPPPAAPPPPWAGSTRTTGAGHVAVDVGCAGGRSASAIDSFLRERVGPVIGWDYQHVYPLGGDRYLWLFQDAFVDHSGTAATLDRASFVHNAALLQQGSCFTLLHRGSTSRPAPFEAGAGGGTLSRWYWPMGGELSNGRLQVFWAEMVKDGYDPHPPDGLGWHPVRTWLATYDAGSLARLSFVAAADSSASPIYGYAVASDATHTYLFGNTFEQNMVREGGFWNGPHSATYTWLARVPRGRLADAPEYRTADHAALLRRGPVPATLPRRPVGRGVEGRRVLGRAARGRRRQRPVGTVDERADLCPVATRQRPVDEHLPRPPAAVARSVGRAGRHRVEQRAQHAARRVAASAAVSADGGDGRLGGPAAAPRTDHDNGCTHHDTGSDHDRDDHHHDRCADDHDNDDNDDIDDDHEHDLDHRAGVDDRTAVTRPGGTMWAWTVDRPGPDPARAITRRDVARPEPGPGELLVEVQACGVCRTDLHVAMGDLPVHRPGVVPGHEVVGRVVATGDGTQRFHAGDRVGVAWLRGTCGRCRFCIAGRENLCLTPRFTGWDDDGGYAEATLVPEAFAYALPESFDDVRAAPLLCAGIIGFRALERSGLRDGGVLGIYGFGASAHITAQLALHRGARVHVMTRSAAARALALDLGCASASGAHASPPEPLDSAITFAPAGELVPLALAALDRGGTLAIAGIHLTDVPPLDYQEHLFQERQVRSVTANTREDGRRFLAEAVQADVRVHTTVYPFDAADRALSDLLADRVDGAAVLAR